MLPRSNSGHNRHGPPALADSNLSPVILRMVVGFLAVYSLLFGIGYWRHGDYVHAAISW